MKVAIDARWIFASTSGVGVHTRELIRHLIDLDTDTEFVLIFCDHALRQRTLAELNKHGHRRVSAELIPASLFSLRNQLTLPGWLTEQACDVYHSTNYMIPIRAFPRGCQGRPACVTTIHDVIPLVFPDHAPKSRKSRLFPVYRWLMREVGARSDAIITVSQASCKDIIKHLAIPETDHHKLHVIHNGVSPRFTPAAAPASPPSSSTPRTLLYVGRFDPYKNVTGLVRVFAQLKAIAPFPVRLVVAGSRDPRYPEAYELADELGVSADMTWTGHLNDETLLATFQSADVLVHPSRYEGFGLQILEAMACGVPVVSSRAASLPEVAGDAAILLDPDDTEGFVKHIHEVLTNPALAQSLRDKGVAQAARFTWRRAAEETLGVYQRLTERRS